MSAISWKSVLMYRRNLHIYKDWNNSIAMVSIKIKNACSISLPWSSQRECERGKSQDKINDFQLFCQKERWIEKKSRIYIIPLLWGFLQVNCRGRDFNIKSRGTRNYRVDKNGADGCFSFFGVSLRRFLEWQENNLYF